MDAPRELPTSRRLALWVLLLAFFMDLLDSTIVNVAMPSIRAALDTSYAAVQWIIAGYTLAFAVCLLAGGRLGDIFGYKPAFAIGMTGFTAASLGCGVANSAETLIAARVVQGAMAALMVPQILALIQVLYPPHERGGISAMYGTVAGIATISGPIVGALLIAADVWGMGWRSIFLVNVPVGIAAVALGARYLPSTKSPRAYRLDLAGTALASCAVLLLMVPLIHGPELGWPWWCLVSFAGSLLVFAAFRQNLLRAERAGGSPLVSPALFRTRSFVAGNLIAGAFFGVISGFFLMLVLFLQLGLRYGVLEAGLTGIPFSLGVSVASAMTGSVLMPRFGRRVLSAGPIVTAIGLALLLATARQFGASTTPWQLLPALVVSGVGMGFVVASIVAFTLVDVPVSEAGAASGAINAIDQVGAALGIALFGSLFFGSGAGGGDYLGAFERALPWLIAVLFAIFVTTLLLPLRLQPAGGEHLAEAA